MDKFEKEPVFSVGKKACIAFLIVGIILIALSIYLVAGSEKYISHLTNISLIFSNFNQLANFAFSPELGALGIVFIAMIFNYKNTKVKNIALVFGVCAIVAIIFVYALRVAFIFLLLDLIIFVILIFLTDSLVTVITLSFYFLPWALLVSVLLNRFSNYSYAIIYTSVTLCLITYMLFGTKLNKAILRFIFGDDKANGYNSNILKHNLTIIYIVIFILLNVSGDLYNDKFNIYNLLNNSFLTAVTILSVDWKEAFHIEK